MDAAALDDEEMTGKITDQDTGHVPEVSGARLREVYEKLGVPGGELAAIAANDQLPRYVRMKRRADSKGECEVRKSLLALGATPVDWVPNEEFFMLPARFRLVDCPLYVAGDIYGMDVSSGAAVLALDPQPGDNVLDLCCCPGAKLCMAAEMMQGRGSITGIDISQVRLTVCRQIMIKYKVGRPTEPLPPLHIPKQDDMQSDCNAHDDDDSPAEGLWCCLLRADGCTFTNGPHEPWRGPVEDVVFHSRAYDWHGMEKKGQQKMNRSTRSAERKALRALGLVSSGVHPTERDSRPPPHPIPQTQQPMAGEMYLMGAGGGGESVGLYDRVLVDADCTGDGSLRHMLKVAALDDELLSRGLLSKEKLDSLQETQRGLIRNGFRLLRPGGVMVYSTCSLAEAQNEDIVRYLLGVEPCARLEGVDIGEPAGGVVQATTADDVSGCVDMAADGSRSRRLLPCRWGNIPGTLVFEPRFGTSGLFIARITKVAED